MAASVGTKQLRNFPEIRPEAGWSRVRTAMESVLAPLPTCSLRSFQSIFSSVKKLAKPVALLTFALSAVVTTAHAQWESHQQITNTARTYLESLPPAHQLQNRSVITIGKIDKRLKLAACASPLSASLSGKKALGRVSVEVSCPEGKHWKIRIPANVSVFVPVAIASNPIPRTKALSKGDIYFEERDISKLFKGYYTKNDAISGLVARTQIRANTPLSPGLLQPPRLVKRGQSIDLFVKTRNYEIHSEGKALSDGAKGDVIRVKNSRSQKIVQGTVVGPGLVRISHHSNP